MGRRGWGNSLSSIITWVTAAVRMTTVAAAVAAPRVPVWVLDDHARAGHILMSGGHWHTTVPNGISGGHRVHHLLWMLGVHRYGLWVPVHRLSVRSSVRPPVHVAVSASRDGDCSGGWVPVIRAMDEKARRKDQAISVPSSEFGTEWRRT